ncbi:unnamed protein product [Protopolystoma xenopodis]|uniref:Uncharacterized protein n=1 Tax=Protopolystoma xenopodis TaxID=117903 RepID=A0A448XML4_9PLAT|nr:unnamed protein product [Protopolystoma xenopodis]
MYSRLASAAAASAITTTTQPTTTISRAAGHLLSRFAWGLDRWHQQSGLSRSHHFGPSLSASGTEVREVCQGNRARRVLELAGGRKWV